MTAKQALALIREKEGNLCVRLHRRSDGRLLTADCPVGVRAKLARAGRRVAVAGWVLLGVVSGLLGCVLHLMTIKSFNGRAWPAPPWERQKVMGDMCPPNNGPKGPNVPEDRVAPDGEPAPRFGNEPDAAR